MFSVLTKNMAVRSVVVHQSCRIFFSLFYAACTAHCTRNGVFQSVENASAKVIIRIDRGYSNSELAAINFRRAYDIECLFFLLESSCEFCAAGLPSCK